MKAQLARLASSYQTLISLFTGAIALVVFFSDSVKKLIEANDQIPQELRPYGKWIVIGLLLLVGLFAFLQALARRSVLMVKERFQISPGDPRHLVGREEDFMRLSQECAHVSTSLLFLTGESGAGKSALVRAGLAEYLRGNSHWTQPPKNLPDPPDLIPILLDGAAIDDWEAGIEKALRRVLPTDTEECQKLGIPPFASSQSPFDWLRSVHDTSCYRVLLVLDQMDDYVAMHRQFLFSEGKVVSASKVVATNAQWKKLAELVEAHQICLLLICRADSAIYLEAFRFTDPETAVIFRLHQEILSPLLDAITQAPEGQPEVILDPEHGWLQLRSRLLRDLADGASEILPIRLVVALSSLRTFRFLTVGEYQKAGRAAGLERLHIENVIRRASQASNLSAEALLRVLQYLISADASKTQRHTLQEMATSAGVDSSYLKLALQYFENEHLVRRIPSETDDDSFMLYHDQLARGIRDAARARDHWNVLLQERAKAHADAIGWADRWRTLIPLWEQPFLVWQRITGRLRFGAHRGYAFRSIIRSLPVFAICGILMVSILEYQKAGIERRSEQIVSGLVAQIGMSGDGSYEDGWHAFAKLPSSARLHGLKYILASPSLSRSFDGHADQLAHVIFGLDVSAQMMAESLKIFQGIFNDGNASFAAEVAQSLPWSNDHRQKVILSIVQSMIRPETKDDELSRLGDALGVLAARLPKTNQDVKRGIGVLVERYLLNPEPESYQTGTGDGDTLEGLIALLPEGDAEIKKWADSILECMVKAETNSDKLPILGAVLGGLATRMPEGDAEVKRWADILLEFMDKPSAADSVVSSLGAALSRLAVRLKGDQEMRQAGDIVVGRIVRDEADFIMLSSLGDALVELAARLPEGDAAVKKWAAVLVDKMVKPGTDLFRLDDLGNMLGGLAARLPESDENVKKGAAKLVEAMLSSRTDSFFWSGIASTTLPMLIARLPRDDIELQKWAVSLTEVLVEVGVIQDQDELLPLGALLGALAAHVSGEDQKLKSGATAFVQKLVGVVQNPALGGMMSGQMVEMSGRLVARLPEGDTEVRKGFSVLMEFILKGNENDDARWPIDRRQESVLMSSLGLLAARLPEGDAEVHKGVAALVERMAKRETDSRTLLRLGQVLSVVSVKLPKGDMQLSKGVAVLVQRMTESATGNVGFWNIFAKLAESGRLSLSEIDKFASELRPLMLLRPDQPQIAVWTLLEHNAALMDKGDKEPRVQAYLDVLKHPQCIGDGRACLIQGLEKVVEDDFTPEGSEVPDVSKVVEWVTKMNQTKGWHLNLHRDGESAG